MALHFAESRVNILTNDVGDPLIGIPEYKVCAIRIEPERQAVPAAAR
jgi:predicted molibdopterin-dependent oxidoreductase YjgC